MNFLLNESVLCSLISRKKLLLSYIWDKIVPFNFTKRNKRQSKETFSFCFIWLHSVEKREIYSQRKNISSNQLSMYLGIHYSVTSSVKTVKTLISRYFCKESVTQCEKVLWNAIAVRNFPWNQLNSFNCWFDGKIVDFPVKNGIAFYCTFPHCVLEQISVISTLRTAIRLISRKK